MKKSLFILTMAMVIFMGSMSVVHEASACVGKKIVIGTLVEPEQKLLANLLALMIRERTGTTVEIKIYSNMEELARALKKEKIQVYNEYLIDAVKTLKLDVNDRDASFKELRKIYNRRFNLIWLPPYGFVNSRVDGGSSLGAAPLIAKQTLKLFPALPRLLSKLGGRVGDAQLNALLNEIKQKKISEEDVARDFLKQEKLI